VRILHRAVHHKQAIEREVNPYKLWYVNNGLYLVGHDHREDDLRTFAVERIQSARLTNRRFEIPPDFNFDEFKQTAFNMIWGEPQEVKIRFSPSHVSAGLKGSQFHRFGGSQMAPVLVPAHTTT
jgi:predicted DNA-binding transcriptional regulator YafY